MQCPDCHSHLSAKAVFCGCGWSKKATQEQASPPKPQCFRCPNDATLRLKIAGRWQNACPICARALRLDEADAYCRDLGITTPAQARAWLKTNRLLVKRAPAPTSNREPGSDDEEVHA